MAIPIKSANPLQAQVDELDAKAAEMTTTAQEAVTSQNTPAPTQSTQAQDPEAKKRNTQLRQEADLCKRHRQKLVANWTVSIDYRRGKPFASQTDEDQVAVNLDWSYTKAKQAALFSQLPQVRLTMPEAATFEKKLNDKLRKAGIESAMDECLPDCINAAGFGVISVSYECITEDKEVPVQDPSTLAPGQEPELTTVPQVVDCRYLTQRISPADFLWPLTFTGSNFDNAPWIGRSGKVTWAQAQRLFNLTEADKLAVLGEEKTSLDKLTHDIERDKETDDNVSFDEIFYKDYQYISDVRSYSSIHRLVFVGGKDTPVIDEPWKGQQLTAEGVVVGSQKYPIRVLTLAYLSDEAIPPSDSAIGRPQVNEINKARTQMIKQRERSLPVRWFDVNRIDPAVAHSLMRGVWQAMIPVQGEGSRIIGEVAKASMPQENFLFDKIAKTDLQEEWTISQTPEQLMEAKGDVNQNISAHNTQAGRERAKVASFICSIAEVLGGLMCLYEDPASLGKGFDPAMSRELECTILADSTVLLDASQKLSRLNQFMNVYGKSGWVDLEPVLKEIAILTGLDPNTVVKAPQPKPPVEPNISLRLTGVEDMLNPLALAFLIKSGQAPPPELIEQAKMLIQQAVVPPQVAGQEPGVPGQEPQMGPDGQPLPPGAPPSGPPIPPPVKHEGGPPAPPSPAPHPVGEAHPQWTSLPQVNKRTEGNEK